MLKLFPRLSILFTCYPLKNSGFPTDRWYLHSARRHPLYPYHQPPRYTYGGLGYATASQMLSISDTNLRGTRF